MRARWAGPRRVCVRVAGLSRRTDGTMSAPGRMSVTWTIVCFFAVCLSAS